MRIHWIFCGLPKWHILLIRPFTHILMENIAVFVMICSVEAKEWNYDKSNLACIIASTSIDIVIPNTQNMIFVCTLMSCQMQQQASIMYRLLFLFSISSISFECWYIDSQTLSFDSLLWQKIILLHIIGRYHKNNYVVCSTLEIYFASFRILLAKSFET